MPELPEVEMVRTVLEPQLIGETISNVHVLREEIVSGISAEKFCRELTGETVAKLKRRGKFLTICFQSGKRVVLHFRMTGILLLTPPAYEPLPHTHLILRLASGGELQFSDQRRFGRWWLVDAGAEDAVSGISRLGPEPFDETITPEYLSAAFCGRTKTVKECLMDQALIAGIGNIYSDEILHRAGVRPDRRADTLSAAEIAGIAQLIAPTIRFFVEKNAISAQDYLNGQGKDYRNSPYLDVYGRGGKPCRRCGCMLTKKTVGGRGSVFCAVCQK